MTGEHVFTRGLWTSESITVSGIPRLLAPKAFHIDELVANCLCKKHNEALSPVDQAAIDCNNAARRIGELCPIRASIKQPLVSRMRFTVDGLLLQRWAVKTFLNNIALRRSVLKGWAPPPWLPLVAYGNESLPEGCGLAMIARVGDAFNNSDYVSLGLGTRPGANGPDIALVRLREGLSFLLTWEVPVKEVVFRENGATYFGAQDILYPPTRVNYMHDGRDLKLALEFDWTGSSPDPAVVKLRERYKSPPRK